MQRLAEYIMSHHREAAFFNATELAKAALVSEATVTRLAYMLDFSGYQDIKQALQDHIKDSLDFPRYKAPEDQAHVLHRIMALERSLIDETLASVRLEDFDKAVDYLYEARNIIVVGMHYNKMPASYGAYFLKAFRENVYLVDRLDIDAFNHLKPRLDLDVVLAISTARYPRATQKAVELLKEGGAKIIGLTDSSVSPLAQKADVPLIVPMKFMSYIDPYGAVMGLLHALTTGVFLKNRARAQKRLKNFNVFMDQNDYNLVKNVDVTELL